MILNSPSPLFDRHKNLTVWKHPNFLFTTIYYDSKLYFVYFCSVFPWKYMLLLWKHKYEYITTGWNPASKVKPLLILEQINIPDKIMLIKHTYQI